MNYPVWEIPWFGGASLIALVAVVHVYVAHLAVGGGLFIWLADLKATREADADLMAYLGRHTRFFLLLTMVFGGVTGVGIWFTIALVQPAATSALIHLFVFGWAIEWVCFLGEIVALLVYHYYFDRLDVRSRQIIAFLYALFAWLSLVIINGILCFMLTPGDWLQTRGFWDGFLNPTYLPSAVFRTGAAVMIAGIFGYVTSVFLSNSEFRARMVRYCTKWLLYPVPVLLLSGYWYYAAVPESVRDLAFDRNPDTFTYGRIFLVCSALIFVIGLLMVRRSSIRVQRGLTAVIVLVGLGWMGGFEYVRELARRPYVIRDYMFSTSVLASDVQNLREAGLLSQAKWVRANVIDDANRTEVGRDIFNIQCLPCHTVGGFRNDIVPLTSAMTELGIVSLLSGQGKICDYMPPFTGTREEMEAVAAFVSQRLHGRPPVSEPGLTLTDLPPVDLPSFDAKQDAYVLLAWSDWGMRSVTDFDRWFAMLPPGISLGAQLIRRGELPELITEDVEITYRVEPGHVDPASRVAFWDYAERNYGRPLKRGVGLSGNGMSGKMVFDEELASYSVPQVPVVPHRSDGSYSPFPLFTIEARGAESGELLASTKVITAVSTETGCGRCHTSGTVGKGETASDATARGILAAHDRRSGTDLLAEALAGNPRLCQSCHADAALDAEGQSGVLNMSAAIHGFHANYVPYDDERACVVCHPAGADGMAKGYRGVHATLDVTCVSCHGTLQEHAISLLNGQTAKPQAARLLAHLETGSVSDKGEVTPRTPWLIEPDCLSCHEDFQRPAGPASSFNKWVSEPSELYRKRVDGGYIRCPACHGPAHALYPAVNPMERNRDVIQPLQYSGSPYPIGSENGCPVCHTVEMEDPIHHENMQRPYRNKD